MFLYHIIKSTVSGIIRYPYQLIDVAKGVKGMLESFIQCIRCSAIFCMGVFLILQ